VQILEREIVSRWFLGTKFNMKKTRTILTSALSLSLIFGGGLAGVSTAFAAPISGDAAIEYLAERNWGFHYLDDAQIPLANGFYLVLTAEDGAPFEFIVEDVTYRLGLNKTDGRILYAAVETDGTLSVLDASIVDNVAALKDTFPEINLDNIWTEVTLPEEETIPTEEEDADPVTTLKITSSATLPQFTFGERIENFQLAAERYVDEDRSDLGDVTWTVEGLPTGLSFDEATRTISGTPTPTNTGAFTASVRVVDNIDDTIYATQTLTGNVHSHTVAITNDITNNALPIALVNLPYSYTFTAVRAVNGEPISAADAAITWRLVPPTTGTLPNWLRLNDTTGVLSGTPTSANTGTVNVTVEARYNDAVLTTRDLTLRVAAPTLTVSSAAPAAGATNRAYTHTFVATARVDQTVVNVGAISWRLTSGALPNGLSLNATTGVLSGTPTTSGTFNFTIEASDAGGRVATQTVALAIAVGPSAATGGMLTNTITMVSAGLIIAGLGLGLFAFKSTRKELMNSAN